MSKHCENCGAEIGENCKYCTECGVMSTDKSTFTYSNRTFKEPSLYNYKVSSDTVVNQKYSKLVKNMNATFAIGVGILVAFVALLIWLSVK